MDIKTIIFGRTRKTRILIFLSIALGGMLLLINFLYLISISQLFTSLNLLASAIIIGPSIYLRYKEFKEFKEIESRFPDFLRDVTEAISAGMTLPQAIKSTSRNTYGTLTPHVKKIIAQMDWGIPFENILQDFANKVGSKVLKRTVTTIVETHRGGGNIVNVLEAVGKSILEVEKIKKERSSHIYAQMITGYTIFFVFLGVMIGLLKFLIPSLSFVSSPEMGMPAGGVPLESVYREMFQQLIIIQGLFSGLAIGKMAEGSIIAGFKHSLVLVAIGFTVFMLAIG